MKPRSARIPSAQDFRGQRLRRVLLLCLLSFLTFALLLLAWLGFVLQAGSRVPVMIAPESFDSSLTLNTKELLSNFPFQEKEFPPELAASLAPAINVYFDAEGSWAAYVPYQIQHPALEEKVRKLFTPLSIRYPEIHLRFASSGVIMASQAQLPLRFERGGGAPELKQFAIYHSRSGYVPALLAREELNPASEEPLIIRWPAYGSAIQVEQAGRTRRIPFRHPLGWDQPLSGAAP